MSIVLKGISWAHTRALAPLQVTSQVYKDFHPEVSIEWHTRSLFAFGEGSLDQLAKQYDLLLIDHPFMGMVAESNLLLPLDQEIDRSILNKLAQQSVGQSYSSYSYHGHQWALPIDGAAQVAAARSDLLNAAGYAVPRGWHEVMILAAETKKVAMPMAPMGLLGAFFTLCANQGELPFSKFDNKIIDDALGENVLLRLKSLFALMPGWCLEAYPPFVFNKMVATAEIWYVPISYGYVNYSMKGYTPTLIDFHNIPSCGNAGCSGATLGGVGIALSANTSHKKTALDYISWVASAECQKTLYAYSGGQAANREAWNDETANSITNNFYRNTLETLDASFMRPTYNGFHGFQSFAGRLLQDYLKNDLDDASVLKLMNKEYIKSVT